MKNSKNTTSSGNLNNSAFNSTQTLNGNFNYTNPNQENNLYDFHQNLNNFYGPGHNGFYDSNPVLGGPGSCIHTYLDYFNVDKDIECYILHNNNRLKKYNNKVFLDDKSEFEIEMFNPNTFTVGVKIKLNGEYISNAHLVLYPGQKLKLDRYLDENKKFLFHTYEVDNNKEAHYAIKNNGLVELEFYKEYKKPVQQQYTRTRGFGRNQNILYSHTNDLIGNDITFSSMSFNDVTGTITLDSLETGIIGKGDKSDTKFTDVDINFELYTFCKVNFQILPLSQKPIEAKDLIIHCTSCNMKLKKNFIYCPNCGKKN